MMRVIPCQWNCSIVISGKILGAFDCSLYLDLIRFDSF